MEQTEINILNFRGRITFEKIGILLHELNIKKQDYAIRTVLYKKLLTLMIEVLENMYKYSENFEDFIEDQPEFAPEFELRMEEGKFVLFSRNPVRKKDCKAIAEKIERLNSSDPVALKKFYRETITNGIFTDKGGAGLGLIEIAKVIDGEIEYSFTEARDDFMIFTLILTINYTDTQ